MRLWLEPYMPPVSIVRFHSVHAHTSFLCAPIKSHIVYVSDRMM